VNSDELYNSSVTHTMSSRKLRRAAVPEEHCLSADDDDAAKAIVLKLIDQLGFDAVDARGAG
jgi:predicted dinucleotide-binding enzyme